MSISDFKERNLGLDVIRAIAVTLVVLSHTVTVFYPYASYRAQVFLNIFTWAGGYYGVELFFVLSGFLIGGIFINKVVNQLKEEANLPLVIGDFWIRRWIRTLPSYLLFLVVNICMIPITNDVFNWNIFFRFLFFCQGIGENQTSFFGVSWSLAVEEWFYLLLPIIFAFSLLLFKRKGVEKAFVASMLFLWLLPFCFKTYRLLITPTVALIEPVFHFRTFYKLDSIFYGVLLSWIWTVSGIKQWFVRNRNLLFAVGLVFLTVSVLCAVLWIIKPQQNTLNVFFFGPICTIPIFLCFPFLIERKFNSHHPVSRIVTQISLSSYSLYLCHIPVVVILDYAFTKLALPPSFGLSVLVFCLRVTISVIIARYLYQYFEIPVLAQREKISRRLIKQNLND
ncbi:MAG: acyltransferase [Bacteroidota bacterium]